MKVCTSEYSAHTGVTPSPLLHSKSQTEYCTATHTIVVISNGGLPSSPELIVTTLNPRASYSLNSYQLFHLEADTWVYTILFSRNISL